MDEIERQLLENIFDALDRLFDKESSATDLFALLYATNRALGDSFQEINFNYYISQLEIITRSNKPIEQQREEALTLTNSLRSTLNELLPI